MFPQEEPVSEDHAAIMSAMEKCGGKLIQADETEALIVLPSQNNLNAFMTMLEPLGLDTKVTDLNVLVKFKD